MHKGMKNAIARMGLVIIIVVIIIIAGAAAVYYATTSTSPTATTGGTGSSTSCNMTQLTFCVPTIAKPSNSTFSNNQVVTLGFLDDLTSQLSAQGIRANASAWLAISDVNNWLAHNDTAWSGAVKFNLAVEDYALDHSKASSIMSTYQAQGVSVVLGPLDSGTTGAILSYADSNHMVLISPSSTSLALATPNDYLFRTAPNDAAQGLADAREMYQEGVKALILVHRQDTYGSGLANATAARFTALGGTVVDNIPYDVTTTDFSSVLATIQSDWNNAVKTYGNSSVAIQAISFEELGTLLLQAKSSYPSLLNTVQPWYGSDGEADDTVLTNSTYASVMDQIRLPSTLYIQTNTTRTNAVCQYILAQTHSSCDAYSLGSYDDVWIAALAVLQCGTYSGTCIQKALPQVANETVGVTGPLTLQPSGDRVPVAYDIWTVSGSGGTATWNIAGSWTISADAVTWISEPKH